MGPHGLTHGAMHSHAPCMHSQVEEQLREKMESNNLGVPQTPGSVKDQFDWLFKIQLCKMLGQYDESLKVAAGKIEGLCNELKAKADSSSGGSFADIFKVLRGGKNKGKVQPDTALDTEKVDNGESAMDKGAPPAVPAATAAPVDNGTTTKVPERIDTEAPPIDTEAPPANDEPTDTGEGVAPSAAAIE